MKQKAKKAKQLEEVMVTKIVHVAEILLLAEQQMDCVDNVFEKPQEAQKHKKRN